MTTNDGTGPDEESSLDLAVNCGECGEPITLTIETPIGLAPPELKLPTALCSEDCVQANVKRLGEVFDHCACGAGVKDTDVLHTSATQGIVGCAACDYTGRPIIEGAPTHYWTRTGALCQPVGESTKHLNLSIRRQMVDCAGCLHVLVAAATAAAAAEGVPS